MAWRGLVLGGGGVKGEFQLGFLQALAEATPRWEFDFFAGVSVGALNASVVAQYSSLAEGVSRLADLWDSITKNDHVYTSPLGTIGGLTASIVTSRGIARDSIFGSGPLARRIGEHVSWERLASARKTWAIGVTNMNDGEYYVVTNDQALLDKDFDRRRKRGGGGLQLTLKRGQYGSIPDRVGEFILASASMPLLFPPVDVYEYRWLDGGLRDITPLSIAIDASEGKAEKPTILTIATSRRVLPPASRGTLDSGREIILRAIEIMTNEILDNDIEHAGDLNEVAKKVKDPRLLRVLDLHTIRPEIHPGLDSLDFENAGQRKRLRQHGYELGKAFAPSA